MGGVESLKFESPVHLELKEEALLFRLRRELDVLESAIQVISRF